MTSPQAEPPLTQIEQAERAQPIATSAVEDNLPSPPQLSKVGHRVNLAILAFTAAFYVVGGFCLVLQTGSAVAVPGAWGLASLLVCVHALRSHRILGVAFRSRLIARREREPILYWASFSLFAISGVFMVFVFFTVGRK